VILALIAAIAGNRIIGSGNAMPWHIPEDLKRFKRLTTGHPVVMGRKTWESLGRSLPNRRNVVISSTAIGGVESYKTIEEALAALRDAGRVFVIGGGNVFAQMLEMADEIYLTLVHRDVKGDVFFPPYEHLLGTRFAERFREEHGDFDFVEYARLPDP
jgi:dihydrofolate reductase